VFRTADSARIVRSLACVALMAGAVLCFGEQTGLAQATGAAAPAAKTTPAIGGRSMAMEAMFTVAMAGLALYAVCRSSRRN
jgi:hypothetical protein